VGIFAATAGGEALIGRAALSLPQRVKIRNAQQHESRRGEARVPLCLVRKAGEGIGLLGWSCRPGSASSHRAHRRDKFDIIGWEGSSLATVFTLPPISSLVKYGKRVAALERNLRVVARLVVVQGAHHRSRTWSGASRLFGRSSLGHGCPRR
jgi:hypothetical protein